MAVVGTAKELPKVDLPNCKILVDVESFHQDMVRAVYNCKTGKPEEYVARIILNRFQKADDVEYFLDGLGNQEKHGTSMARRDKKSSLVIAEEIVEQMKAKAVNGRCIKKADYRKCSNILKSCTPVTFDFKEKLAEELKRQLVARYDKSLESQRPMASVSNFAASSGPTMNQVRAQLDAEKFRAHQKQEQERRRLSGTVNLVEGEADLAIVHRAKELVIKNIEFVVVGNDCDYAIHPSIPILLRPSGKKYIQYKVDELLAKSGWTRAQYTALGCVSNTDYSSNLPNLGITRNSRIIKSIPESKLPILH